MSKLFEILEIFNEIDFTCDCIKICETTMSDATRALKKDEDSNELKAIYESARSDKERLTNKFEGLKEKFNSLLEQARGDEEFIQDLEKTTLVPERHKKAFMAIKAELTSSKGVEKSEQ